MWNSSIEFFVYLFPLPSELNNGSLFSILNFPLYKQKDFIFVVKNFQLLQFTLLKLKLAPLYLHVNIQICIYGDNNKICLYCAYTENVSHHLLFCLLKRKCNKCYVASLLLYSYALVILAPGPGPQYATRNIHTQSLLRPPDRCPKTGSGVYRST